MDLSAMQQVLLPFQASRVPAECDAAAKNNSKYTGTVSVPHLKIGQMGH
jgi:hypothetical protein